MHHLPKQVFCKHCTYVIFIRTSNVGSTVNHFLRLGDVIQGHRGNNYDLGQNWASSLGPLDTNVYTNSTLDLATCWVQPHDIVNSQPF